MKHFIKGMDLSTYEELNRLGAAYFDGNEQKDLMQIMKEHDVNAIRVRIWNDPYSEDGEEYGAGTNDITTALAIAKKASEQGFDILMDFHYSDFWADPGKQYVPKAWEDLSVEELEQAVYTFTYETVALFLKEHVNVTMVQVGNELSNGLLWPKGKMPEYDHIARFVSAGIKGVHAAEQNHKIRTMIHLDNGGNNALYRDWFDHYMERGEDFDIIGLSYYPFWHGTLDMLTNNMNDIAVRYGKDLIVAEVSMGFTMEDYYAYEGLEQNERKGYATRKELTEHIDCPMSVQGQADFMADFMNRVAHTKDHKGAGFFYWEPGWIPVKGSGWATKASLAYIHDEGPCGNEWANQALFDYDGKKLPALEVIRDYTFKES